MGHLRGVSGAGPSRIDGFELVFLDAEGEQVRRRLQHVSHYRFEDVGMVRRPPSYHGQRNFPGFYWAASNRRLLGYESRLEESNLMILDQQRNVDALSTQPFWLHWEDADGKRRSHAPDAFVRYGDGTCCVVDVRTGARVEQDRWRFETTAEACSTIGWKYKLLSEPAPVLLWNVRWLSGYRRPSPEFERRAPELLERANRPIELRELLNGCDTAVRACAFHLLWTSELTTALDHEPLSAHTVVVSSR